MATYTLISSVTVGSGGAGSIDFTSIPATYTDLVVLLSVRSTNASTDAQLRININGTGVGTNFSSRGLQGDGSSVSSFTQTSGWIAGGFNGGTSTANTFSSLQVYFPNYTGSTNKSFSVEMVMERNFATGTYAELNAILYSNTSVISSLSFTTPSANLAEYSTVYLYGISNA
jgi:hypothetical protein